MALGDFVAYVHKLNGDWASIPDGTPAYVVEIIRYVSDLWHQWGVEEPSDVDYWMRLRTGSQKKQLCSYFLILFIHLYMNRPFDYIGLSPIYVNIHLSDQRSVRDAKEWTDESWAWYESMCKEVDEAGGDGKEDAEENVKGARSTAQPVPYLAWCKHLQSFFDVYNELFATLSMRYNVAVYLETIDG